MSNSHWNLDGCMASLDPPKPPSDAWRPRISAYDEWDDAQIEKEDIDRLLVFDISWDEWDSSDSDDGD
jgi:hypothetical protein